MFGEEVVADSDTMLFEILSYHLLKLNIYLYLTSVESVSKTYSSVNLSAGIALVCHLRKIIMRIFLSQVLHLSFS